MQTRPADQVSSVAFEPISKGAYTPSHSSRPTTFPPARRAPPPHLHSDERGFQASPPRRHQQGSPSFHARDSLYHSIQIATLTALELLCRTVEERPTLGSYIATLRLELASNEVDAGVPTDEGLERMFAALVELEVLLIRQSPRTNAAFLARQGNMCPKLARLGLGKTLAFDLARLPHLNQYPTLRAFVLLVKDAVFPDLPNELTIPGIAIFAIQAPYCTETTNIVAPSRASWNSSSRTPRRLPNSPFSNNTPARA